MYKKIQLKLKGGYITPLQSDTLLGYIFGYNFELLKDIFNDFVNNNPPFILSNGFNENLLPSLLLDRESKLKEIEDKKSLSETLKNEKDRKKIKKAKFQTLESIQKSLQNNEKIEENNKLKIESYYKYKDAFLENITIYKNSIPRFNKGDTDPYFINDIKYSKENFNIYVNIKDEKKFDKFYNILEKTLLSIGFGAGKTKGFGHFNSVKLLELNKKEKETFHIISEYEKNNNKKIILNNVILSKKDINNINIENSNIDILTKHTKSLSEFNEFIFKGKMNFIKAGSVLSIKENIKGCYYKSNNSYNFGFIF